MAGKPLMGQGHLAVNASRTHSVRHTIGLMDEWSARRRDLYVTTQHLQHTDIHAPGGIRTHNPAFGLPQADALDRAANISWILYATY